MPRPPKFNFIPVTQKCRLTRSSQAFVSINSTGSIVFNRACIEQYNLANKYIQFFIDTDKKMFGWQILDKTIHEFKDIKSKKYRLIKLTKWHTATLSIRVVMKEIDLLGTTFSKLKINKYIDTIYNTIYYVTLTK